MRRHEAWIDSSVGWLRIVGDDEAVTAIEFHHGREPDPAPSPPADGPVVEARRQLGEYFDGRRREFQLPLRADGTAFQLATWRALREIPYGETISYGEVARRIGEPRAFRAVGSASGSNPLPIVVPCHRVIGADGSLTGYGGGLEIKSGLLSLEGARTGA